MTKDKEKDKELTDKIVRLKIEEFRDIDESNIIFALWKNQEFYLTYDLTIDSFTNNYWKVAFQIGYDIVVKENMSLDDITVGNYLAKHPKLEAKFNEMGGYEALEKGMGYVKQDNIEAYINSSIKWKVLLKLMDYQFPIAKRFKHYIDMSLNEIYEEYEALLNHTFIDSDKMGGDTRCYDITEGLDTLIEELDEGVAIGLPYYELDIFNRETNGLNLGEMYLILAPSGVGKSSFCRSNILPSILANNEKIVVMINEEDFKKQQKEMLIWIANNIFANDLQKYKLNNGKFSPKVKELLYKCANWLKEHKKQINMIALDRYTTDKAIRIIKKYASLGVKYFILDTFKHDSTSGANDNSWLDLQMNSVKLYDTIKPVAKNVCLVCTMQLTKASTKQRCFTMENISGAKNVVDVVSGCYMIRWVLPDEYTGEKRDLQVHKIGGKNGKTKIPVTLEKDKRYQLMFLTKNRFGSSNEFCIVFEVDLSRNTYKEVGICVITPDW